MHVPKAWIEEVTGSEGVPKPRAVSVNSQTAIGTRLADEREFTSANGEAMNSLVLFAQQQPDDGGGALGGLLGFMCIFWALAIVASLFWLWMLIDALVNEKNTNDKILWFLVIFFLHILGALIYFFVRKRGRASGGP